MYNFIVLGLVPGTHIQITFQDWVNLVGLLIVVVGLHYLFQPWRLVIRQFVAEETQEPLRIGLHATQLHRRG